MCAVSTTQRTGCEVVSANLTPKKPIAAHLDKRALTARKPGSKYFDLVFASYRLWALFDTGANFSMITTKLCRELGLAVAPFDKQFSLANGVTKRFAGCLPEVVIQLHDRLDITLCNVRVMEAGYSGLLLGTDVLSEEGNGVLTQVSIAKDGQHTLLTVEVAETDPSRTGPGLRVALPLYRAGPVGVDAHVGTAKEGGGRRDLGEAAKSSVPRDVRNWCTSKGMSDRMVDNAWEGMLTTLNLGVPMKVVVCGKCKMPHVDYGRWAKFGHMKHHCHNCSAKTPTTEPVVCNVLAAWNPVVESGSLWLDKDAPSEFVGEMGEFAAELSVLPPGQTAMKHLFKHEAQANLAEGWLREECGSADPVRDAAALRTALQRRCPVTTERCPRCRHNHVDLGDACSAPHKGRTCP